MEELKILDDILRALEAFGEKDLIPHENVFKMLGIDVTKESKRLMYTTLEKLVEDGYAKYKEIGKDVNHQHGYFITYKGVIFLKKGGYVKEYENELLKTKVLEVDNSIRKNNERVLSVYTKVLAWVTTLLLAWTIFYNLLQFFYSSNAQHLQPKQQQKTKQKVKQRLLNLKTP